MAYHIETTYYSGYKCSCCLSTWELDDGVWMDNLEEALMCIPTVSYFRMEGGDVDIYKVTVTDGSTGSVIAEGSVDWPLTSKYAGEQNRRWSGYTPSGPFEYIKARGEAEQGLTWDEILAKLKNAKREKDLAKARTDLEQAQAKVNALETL